MDGPKGVLAGWVLVGRQKLVTGEWSLSLPSIMTRAEVSKQLAIFKKANNPSWEFKRARVVLED